MKFFLYSATVTVFFSGAALFGVPSEVGATRATTLGAATKAPMDKKSGILAKNYVQMKRKKQLERLENAAPKGKVKKRKLKEKSKARGRENLENTSFLTPQNLSAEAKITQANALFQHGAP